MNNSNSTEEGEFFDAIAHGQIEEVGELVRADPELLQAFDYKCFGATPVTRVCFHDDREMLQVLVVLGADINRRSDWPMGPWSPLHCAVMGRNHELANYLLENGATLDVHTAAGLGRVDDLKQMLDASPELANEPGGDGCQPLHFADTPEVAQLLLDGGANIEARCIDHYSTPVQYLAESRTEVARYLFTQGANVDIFSAIVANDLPVVEKTIKEDPDVLDARINQQFFPPGPDHDVHNIMTFTIGGESSPMHAATKANRPQMVELLVNAGQSSDIRGGYDNGTPLHIAAWNNHCEVAKALIDHGADINARSGEIHNNSPAGWAIVAGSADFFDLMIDHGAEVHKWFLDDAQAAIDGRFRQFKIVPQECYKRVFARLKTPS